MDKVLGILTDGVASIVVRISGAVTRLERTIKPNLYRVEHTSLTSQFKIHLKFHSDLHFILFFIALLLTFVVKQTLRLL